MSKVGCKRTAAAAETSSNAFNGPWPDDIIRAIFPYLRAADFAAQHAGVYLLYAGNECVYVGKSGNVAARIGQHLYHRAEKKKFDRVLYVPTEGRWTDLVERKLIVALQPKHNGLRRYERPDTASNTNGKT